MGSIIHSSFLDTRYQPGGAVVSDSSTSIQSGSALPGVGKERRRYRRREETTPEPQVVQEYPAGSVRSGKKDKSMARKSTLNRSIDEETTSKSKVLHRDVQSLHVSTSCLLYNLSALNYTESTEFITVMRMSHMTAIKYDLLWQITQS